MVLHKTHENTAAKKMGLLTSELLFQASLSVNLLAFRNGADFYLFICFLHKRKKKAKSWAVIEEESFLRLKTHCSNDRRLNVKTSKSKTTFLGPEMLKGQIRGR